MAYAKHIIQRQLIELEIGKSIDRLTVQNKMSAIYRQQIVPLLDELLSQMSSESSSIIIDRLELDIGTVSLNEMEEGLVQKVIAALQEKLNQITATSSIEISSVLKPAVSQQQKHSDAELLSYFLQTGLLPWWAQETTYAYLEERLKEGLNRNDTSFRKEFTSLLQSDEAVKRLIYTFNDALLVKLILLYVTVDSRELLQLKEKLTAIFVGRLTVEQLRILWWTALYQTAGNFSIYFEKEVLQKASWRFIKVVAQQAVWPQLTQWYDENENRTEVLESMADFLRLNEETRAEQRQEDAVKAKADEELAINDERREATKNTSDSSLESTKFDSAKDMENQLLNNIQNHNIASSDQKSQPYIDKATTKNKQPKQALDVDKVYIQNAGLVLLWPFLHRFFQHIELADNKSFLDEAAAERACLLLQYLATGNTEVFEASLPLNKMLCGVPLLQPLNMEWAITEKEIVEAESFLLAVIENAGTIWKNLSVNGLRQAYLQREGILSSRDGAWLLQVERKPYDILLERLPWTFSIVKLSWMKGLVFVEW